MASRRAADALIAAGAVRVNGRRPPPEGTLIDPDIDEVTVEGRSIAAPARHRYLLLNKPAGVLVTASDPVGRSTVFDLLGEDGGGRLFAVGRLDMDTKGLLILTDDGELSNRLAHPRHKVTKEYVATVSGVPGERDLRRLRHGLELEDGLTAPASAELVRVGRGGLTELRIAIHEGRNRQVRRMLEAIGHPARDLVRVGFGPVRLGRLKEGSWRRLRNQEVDALRRAAGPTP